jgi:hypothetical protein
MLSRSFIENSAPDLYLRIAYQHLSKWRHSEVDTLSMIGI